jgi:arabinose-5-phosphate isomerase
MEIKTGKSVIDIEIKALELLKKSISKSFLDAVLALHKTKGKIVLSGIGKSGHIAKKISSTLSSIGSPSFFIHPAEANHGDLGMISKNESVILISNSGETIELFNIILHCQKLKTQIIAITSDKSSTLSKNSNILLEIPKNVEACPLKLAPTSSTTMSLVLGDALAMALLEKNKFTKKKFSELHPGGKLGRMLLKVKDIMKKEELIPLISETKKMGDAIIEISSKGFGCVGIISSKNKKLIGMITDGDLRRNMNPDLLNKKVTQVMTKNPKTLNQNTFIQDALVIMNNESITNFFITEKNKPIGILHVHDILRH